MDDDLQKGSTDILVMQFWNNRFITWNKEAGPVPQEVFQLSLLLPLFDELDESVLPQLVY